MSDRRDLYSPTDIDAAWEGWKANCGPIAVAAVLGREVNACRDLFDPWPGYTNPTLIRHVIERAGRRIVRGELETVQLGLGFVQFEGPWEKGGARAAYSYTHWVGLARRRMADEGGPFGEPILWAYDAAARTAGGWLPLDMFDRRIMPAYLAETPRSTGWRFRQVWEVSL